MGGQEAKPSGSLVESSHKRTQLNYLLIRILGGRRREEGRVEGREVGREGEGSVPQPHTRVKRCPSSGAARVKYGAVCCAAENCRVAKK